jgi:hypothetical protein
MRGCQSNGAHLKSLGLVKFAATCTVIINPSRVLGFTPRHPLKFACLPQARLGAGSFVAIVFRPHHNIHRRLTTMPIINELSEATTKPARNVDHNDKVGESGAEGGKKDWVSHPHPENTFSDPRSFQSKPISTIELGGDGLPVKRSKE